MKAKARRLLDEAVRRARGLDALEQHRKHKDRDKREIERFLSRYDGPPNAKRIDWDDEVKGGSPLEGIPLPDYIPPTWTIEWVATRMIRAYQHAGWGMPVAPDQRLGFWPEYHHSWGDMVGWDAGEFRARVWEDWAAASRRPISAAGLRLTEQAIAWPLRFLREHEDEAKALRLWLSSKVSRVKIGAHLKTNRWSRSTFQRLRGRALQRIADGLNAAGEAVC